MTDHRVRITDLGGDNEQMADVSAFAGHHEASNAEVARPASTAYRLLGELVVGGLVERTADRRYRAGPLFRAVVDGHTVMRSKAP